MRRFVRGDRAERALRRGVGAGRRAPRGTSGATTGPRGARSTPKRGSPRGVGSAPPNPDEVRLPQLRGNCRNPDTYLRKTRMSTVAELSFARALDILAGTPPVLNAIVSNLPRSAQDERPSAGAWSPRGVAGDFRHAETNAVGPGVRRAPQENDARHKPTRRPATPPG